MTEACIDEWVNGVRVDTAFSQPAYETIYRRHIKDLKQLDVNGQCVPVILHCNVNLI